MASQFNFQEPQTTMKINESIKEFLKFNGYTSTLECLEAEERTNALSKNKSLKKKVSNQKSLFLVNSVMDYRSRSRARTPSLRLKIFLASTNCSKARVR